MANNSSKKVKLTPEQYWSWRSSVAEMQTAKVGLKSAEYENRCLHLEAEIAQLRARLNSRLRLTEAQAQADAQQASYQQLREKLELEIGTTLSNKVIDDVTFEVKDLPNDNNLK